MTYLFKYIRKKILISRLYAKYVKHDKVIQKDVEQTVITRGCTVNPNTLEKKFHHVMQYYPDYAYVFFWRIKGKSHPWRRYFLKEFNCKIFGSTKIEGGLMCYHPYATVINARSIGENFQFRNSLTIGNKFNDNTKIPVIGNNVVVGANVVIIGDIQIGSNVIIGAGSVVVKDVPSNVVIAGNPAKVIRNLYE